MAAVTENEITCLYGTADAFALVAAAFTYPTAELCHALADGSFSSDLRGSLSDMGMESGLVDSLCERFDAAVAGKTADDLFAEMRPEYTVLYYGPGEYRKIYPYESVYRKLQINPQGRATVFVTKSTHDVERSMKRRGAMPEDARREPADFFATELDFMRHLYTGIAAASLEGEGVESWQGETADFLSKHVESWIPSLLRETGEVTELEIYRVFADIGIAVIEQVSETETTGR